MAAGAAVMVDEVVVSVVMPAYNAAKYIGSSVRSVLEQTYRQLELIVIDDCSTDGTAQLVEASVGADARVKVIRLPKNRGAPAGPRNVGVVVAQGKWVAFIDADDIWHPQKLASQMQVLQASGARFCSTQMLDFTDEDSLRFAPPASFEIERIGFLKQLIKFRTPTSSVVADKALLRRHPFNEDLRFKAREDLDCWLHCHEEIGASVKIKHPLIGYRIVPGQISGQKWRMMRRHYHVLRRYRFSSGRGLGPGAALFTFSHFCFALYYRVLRRAL
jgi:teichuronic acid biosynthesis glycosyltransferase TuaG